jgi:prepilin-type N-terminal cleavage/methylation domain-containing protein
MKTSIKKTPAAVSLPIQWADEHWAKPVVLVKTPQALTCPKRATAVLPKLALPCRNTGAARRGFTLIELLVVIGIIALLAALLFPVLTRAKLSGKINAAKTDMRNIESAVAAYQSTYTLAPLPKPNPYNPPAGEDFSFSQTNSDIIVILMDIDFLANAGHARNPQKHSLLTAQLKPGTGPGGVSSDDYNYRDPWGNPYIIAFDLNYDNKVQVGNDPVYGNAYPAPAVGVPRSVLVWSKGPDGQAEQRAGNGDFRNGLNKDNIRSWE